MGGKKGGSSDPSGMYQAMASAQAAQQAYQLGTQQLDWTKQQWAQEWPYMQQVAQGQIQTQNQLNDFARNQQGFYESQYQPLETQFNKFASTWASPQNIALQSGQASANVAEAINQQKAGAQSQLEGYGVNPGATRFAGLTSAMGVAGGAAEAGAGTQAAMQTKMQGAQLLGQAVNTGRGFPNAVASLGGTSSQAGTGATSGLTQGLGTMSTALTNPAQWFNAGANNMGVYVGAVNGYNQTQVGFAEANAMESAGWGSALGGLMGMFSPSKMFGFAEKGGPIEKYQEGGDVTGFTPMPGDEGFGGGFAQGLNASRSAMASRRLNAAISRLSPNSQPATSPTASGSTTYDFGGPAIPSRYFQAGPAITNIQQGQPPIPPANNNQPPQQQLPPQAQPVPPQNGTPGGVITPQMSPSKGQVPDDVDAKLTVGEFVMPLDVVRFKGKEYFYKQIDSARKQEAMQNSRGDIGGEPTMAMPSRNPAFVSRPNAMGIPSRAA